MNIFYLYILLYQDKIVVRDVRTHREMTGIPETPFTTKRLLVGDMLSAAKTLQKTVSRLTSPLPLWKKYSVPATRYSFTRWKCAKADYVMWKNVFPGNWPVLLPRKEPVR